MSSSLLAMKSEAKAREAQEKRTSERRRNLVVLILRYLLDNGYTESYQRLQTESGMSLSRFDAADNIDLDFLLQEFTEYFELKTGKAPKLVRKMEESSGEKVKARRGGSGDGFDLPMIGKPQFKMSPASTPTSYGSQQATMPSVQPQSKKPGRRDEITIKHPKPPTPEREDRKDTETMDGIVLNGSKITAPHTKPKEEAKQPAKPEGPKV